jgi:hypothetical protein
MLENSLQFAPLVAIAAIAKMKSRTYWSPVQFLCQLPAKARRFSL